MYTLTRTTPSRARSAFKMYNDSCSYFLADIYSTCSDAKKDAYARARRIFVDLGGHCFKVFAPNTFGFSVGFLASIDGVQCFVWITRINLYYVPLESF